jgi:transcriptional regulator NrdR family protein
MAFPKGIKCAFENCPCIHSAVVDTSKRVIDEETGGIVRIRKCNCCGRRFETIELRRDRTGVTPQPVQKKKEERDPI